MELYDYTAPWLCPDLNFTTVQLHDSVLTWTLWLAPWLCPDGLKITAPWFCSNLNFMIVQLHDCLDLNVMTVGVGKDRIYIYPKRVVIRSLVLALTRSVVRSKLTLLHTQIVAVLRWTGRKTTRTKCTKNVTTRFIYSVFCIDFPTTPPSIPETS